MAQAVINTNTAISVMNIITSAITSLSKEVIIQAHTYFLRATTTLILPSTSTG